MAVTRDGDVAVFIDFENIYISVHDEHDSDPNFESIMDRCQEYGRVTIARAYADWYRYPRVTSALYANGIEPMYVPTYYYERGGRRGSRKALKNSVDIHLVIDAMRTLYDHPNIRTYVFATGDRDFIPLINSVRQNGKQAVVIGVGGAASSHLAQSADEFVFYRQLAEIEEEAKAKDPYKTLVEAVKVARQRGSTGTMASLKLVLIELMGGFDERDYKGPDGKAFTKFKEFVKEAERRGLVQVFASGTVNEVFLPGEDPYELSQFASRVPTEEEREEEREKGEFSEREWRVFRESMSQFDEPVLFVQIFNALRGLRNQDVIDLSNAEIKDIIKHAIDADLLIRTTKGAHAYYALDPSKPLPV